MTNHRTALLMGISGTILLASCGDREHGDVQTWMRESSKDMRGHIPDLPQIKPLDVQPYEPGDLISPFSMGKVVSGGAGTGATKVAAGGASPVNPDAYPLTRSPLETIRFIGTIIVNKEVRALVQIEREPIRQVKVGDFMGQNHGKILKIEPSTDDSSGQIVLKEKLLDKGVWVERDTVFPALDKGDRK